MVNFKDLIDLFIGLSDRVENREFSRELIPIHREILRLQGKYALSKEKSRELAAENKELKRNNTSLQQQIEELQQHASYQQKETPSQHPSFPEEAKNVLLHLAETAEEGTAEKSASQIAHSISLNLARTEYWLEEFEKKEMVASIHVMAEPEYYRLDQNGRKYLIKNNLI